MSNIAVFYIINIIGNILLIISTLIMWGPQEQIKDAFEGTKKFAIAAYGVCIVVILIIGAINFGGRSAIAFILVIVQLLAIGWYVICNVPGGPKTIKAILFH